MLLPALASAAGGAAGAAGAILLLGRVIELLIRVERSKLCRILIESRPTDADKRVMRCTFLEKRYEARFDMRSVMRLAIDLRGSMEVKRPEMSPIHPMVSRSIGSGPSAASPSCPSPGIGKQHAQQQQQMQPQHDSTKKPTGAPIHRAYVAVQFSSPGTISLVVAFKTARRIGVDHTDSVQQAANVPHQHRITARINNAAQQLGGGLGCSCRCSSTSCGDSSVHVYLAAAAMCTSGEKGRDLACDGGAREAPRHSQSARCNR